MTQTIQPHVGILPVSTDLLEQLLCLPEGYRIISMHVNHLYRTLDFTLESDDLPEAQEYEELPRLNMIFRIETLPGQPHEYRKIIPEVKVL